MREPGVRDTLETERLVLRQWRAADRAPFAALNADPAVMELFPSTLTRRESDALADRAEAAIEAQGWGLWAVEVKDGPEFIGFTGLAVPSFEADFTPCVEVGWRLAASQWGRGYASEAARAAVRHGFDTAGFDEIVSFTSVGNHRSRRVMDQLGMTESGEFDHPGLPDHPLTRHVLYRLSPPGPASGRDRRTVEAVSPTTHRPTRSAGASGRPGCGT